MRENGSRKADAEPSQHGNVTRGVGVQDVDLGCCGNGDAFWIPGINILAQRNEAGRTSRLLCCTLVVINQKG